MIVPDSSPVREREDTGAGTRASSVEKERLSNLELRGSFVRSKTRPRARGILP